MCERVIIEKQMGLKAQIEQFDSERKKQNFISVLHCLRDSYVWIPGTVTMSDIDYESFLNSKDGDIVTTNDAMKFEPDILQNGEDKFYPVFSSIEEMGEYGNNFSKIEKHFFDAMSYANEKKETVGIVVNAFTTPFIVLKEWFDIVGSFPSKVDGDKKL
ncbi:MAG: SseB family protein [Ruminococcaceae bacterium]|nr:SseB family protein [Oscillospiraceae bacterium]